MQVVSKQFEQAVEEGDLASVERFFKIFPLLKMEDEGLAKFSRYLCQEISKSSVENLKQALSMDSSSKKFAACDRTMTLPSSRCRQSLQHHVCRRHHALIRGNCTHGREAATSSGDLLRAGKAFRLDQTNSTPMRQRDCQYT